MRQGRPHKAPLVVRDEDREALLRWTKRPKSSNGLAQRARLHQGEEPQAAEPMSGLTPRESEVLVLLSNGRTNRQIAEELFISERTVGVHVSRILHKLGVPNRGAAAHLFRASE